MDLRATSPRSLKTHFVDIHEVLPEEEEEEHKENKIRKMADHKTDKNVNNKQIKMREMKRQHKSFSRQVSLETGFSVLNRELKEKDERKALPRSGKSFGGFGSSLGVGIEGRKGDFNIFRTKSALVRQNSKLPLRKESGVEPQNNDVSAGEFDESVNRSVPAGRYFAALTGPELDQVKVRL